MWPRLWPPLARPQPRATARGCGRAKGKDGTGCKDKASTAEDAGAWRMEAGKSTAWDGGWKQRGKGGWDAAAWQAQGQERWAKHQTEEPGVAWPRLWPRLWLWLWPRLWLVKRRRMQADESTADATAEMEAEAPDEAHANDAEEEDVPPEEEVTIAPRWSAQQIGEWLDWPPVDAYTDEELCPLWSWPLLL